LTVEKIPAREFEKFWNTLSEEVLIKAVYLSGEDYIIVYLPIGGR
jgi:thiamine monophosphate kinase